MNADKSKDKFETHGLGPDLVFAYVNLTVQQEGRWRVDRRRRLNFLMVREKLTAQVLGQGSELPDDSDDKYRVRGADIADFARQDPLASLDAVTQVQKQVVEAFGLVDIAAVITIDLLEGIG